VKKLRREGGEDERKSEMQGPPPSNWKERVVENRSKIGKEGEEGNRVPQERKTASEEKQTRLRA